MDFAKIRDGTKVRLIARSQNPKRHIFVQPLLNLARTVNAHAIAVDQQLGHHAWIIWRLAPAFPRHTPRASQSGPIGLPRRRQNRPNGLLAAIAEDSGAVGNPDRANMGDNPWA